MKPIESIIEQNASIITEVTETPVVQTVVEETPAIQTVMDSNMAIETVVQQTESPIVSIINQPTVQVTSVNGKTGDVEVDSEIREYQEGKYYKQGSLITKGGKAYISRQDFTAGPFSLTQWQSVGGGVQSDWAESEQDSEAFIKNKPSIPSKTSDLTKDDVFTKTEVQNLLDAKSELPTATNGQFLAKDNSSWIAQSPMTKSQAETATEEVARTISAKALKESINFHETQPDWNATSGKAQILNKPEFQLTSRVIKNLDFQSDGSLATLNLTTTNLNGQDEQTTPIDLSALIDKGIVLPKSIYGMIRGLIGGNAQVTPDGRRLDMKWDENRKLEQNITYDPSCNGWIIPEDGIYTLQAGTQTVDVASTFSLQFQRQDTSGAWGYISTTDMVSYPAHGRGITINTTQHFRKGERVNVILATTGLTRIGEGDENGHSECHFTITRVGLFGNSMPPAQSAQPTGRLVKEVPLNGVKGVNSNNRKTLQVNFAIPEEFRGRKFKIDWAFSFDRAGASGSSVVSTLTFDYREWSQAQGRHVRVKPLGNHNAISWHTHFRDTTLCDTYTDVSTAEILIVDRDGTLNESGRDLVLHGSGARAIIETID